jgi:poly(beta-D-mannuronate) lyase
MIYQGDFMKRFMLVLCLCIATTVHADAGEIKVSSPAELKNAVRSAIPGTTIVVADGEYDCGGMLLFRVSGTADQPIVLKALNRGKALLVGDSRLRLDAVSHVTIEGFDHAQNEGPAIELRGCQYVRVTRNIFHLKESKRSSWVLIDGMKDDTTRLSKWNRVDHNLFENKSVLGNFVTIEGTKTHQPQVSQFDQIDRNHFRDIGPRVENVLEAIRIGSSDFSLSSGFTLLENNLFERCDGDPEYISIKSSDDTVRGNTFRECLGSLSLRHGNRSVVDGNFILGNERRGKFLDNTGKDWTLGTGGIRFCGDDMRITNNYLEGLTGTEWDATFAIIGGDAEYGDGKPLTKHFRIHRAVIANNTLVNNASGFEIGYNGGGFQGNWWPMAPEGMAVENNLIVGSVDTLIKYFNPPVNTKWMNNVAWTMGNAVVAGTSIEGVQVADPELKKHAGLWMPTASGRTDVGSSLIRTRGPLTSKDVGPESE